MRRILLVEDDQSFGYILSEYLKLKGYDVDWRKNSQTAFDALKSTEFALAILDVMLPEEHGFTIAEKLKQDFPLLPFIFLTARDMKIDQLKGYKIGAQDYVTKPIEEEVFLAKIGAILERVTGTPKVKVITYKNIVLEVNNHELIIDGHKIFLSTRECDLLSELLSNPNQLVDRRMLLQKLWNSTDEFARNSMDVFVSKLRKHLASNSDVQIRNVHGKGFVLE